MAVHMNIFNVYVIKEHFPVADFSILLYPHLNECITEMQTVMVEVTVPFGMWVVGTCHFRHPNSILTILQYL